MFSEFLSTCTRNFSQHMRHMVKAKMVEVHNALTVGKQDQNIDLQKRMVEAPRKIERLEERCILEEVPDQQKSGNCNQKAEVPAWVEPAESLSKLLVELFGRVFPLKNRNKRL